MIQSFERAGADSLLKGRRVARFANPLAAWIAFGLMLVALWAAIAYALHGAQREAFDRASVNGRNLARGLAGNMAASVRAIDISLQYLRNEWNGDDAAFAAAVARQQQTLKSESILQVSVIDAGGRLAFSNLPGWQHVDLSDRAHFRVHKERDTDEQSISAPVLGRVSKQWTIQFTRPIHDHRRQFAGVLVLSVPPPALARVYNDIQLGEGNIGLVRSDGQFLADSQNFDRALDVALAPATTPGLRPGDPMSGEYRRASTVNGIDSLSSYRKVTGYPLTVYVRQPVEAVLAHYHAQRAIYLVSGSVATALLWALTLLLISRQREHERAEQERVRLDLVEQRSRSELAEANASLERRVRERTAELEATQATLEDAKDRMDRAVAASGVVLWDANAETGEVYLGEGWAAVMDVPLASPKTNVRELLDLVPAEERAALLAAAMKTLKGETGEYAVEHRVRTRDSGWRWALSRGRVTARDPQTWRALRVVGSNVDITRRKAAEAEVRAMNEHLEQLVAERTAKLRESEAKFRDLAELSSDWFWEQDASLRFTAMSDELYVKTKMRPSSTIGKTRWELPIVGVSEERWRAHRELLERHEPFESLQYQLLNENGDIRWFSINGKPLFGRQGEFRGYRGTGVDITERKQAEAALRAQTERLRIGQSAAGMIVMDWNIGTDELNWSDSCEWLRGPLPEGGNYPLFANQIHPEDREFFLASRAKMIETQQGQSFDYRFVRTDGKLLWIHSRHAVFAAADGKAARLVVALLDITERKHAEETLKDNAARLRELSQRLAQVQEAERRHLAGELHDTMGRDLTALGLDLDIIRSQLPESALSIVEPRLDEARALVGSAMHSVRAIIGGLRPVLLDEWGLLPALRRYAMECSTRSHTEIQVNGSAELARLGEAAEMALFRVAQEALANCAEHAHARRIGIGLAASSRRVVLTIADDGVGFDATQSRQREEQSGIGLLLMRERMAAVGGTLGVESAPGKGTQITAEIQGIQGASDDH